jgi:hypothetical protein
MKKTLFLSLFFALLLVSGCTEQNLLNQIGGTWHVQKYLVDGKDKTYWFDTTKPNFIWTFSGNTFTQNWRAIWVAKLYNVDTIAHLDTTTHSWIVDSTNVTYSYIPTYYTAVAKGTWLLVNGNHFIQTMDSANGNNLYQILDHSSGSLHLTQGTSEYYLAQ